MTVAARDVSLRRGRRLVLAGVDLTLEPGRVLAVLGPNGAGKSTLLKLLAGDLSPSAGAVTLDGQPLGACPPGALARRRAVLPQETPVAFGFRAIEVVGWGCRETDPATREGLVAQALATVEAEALALRPVPTLSGGERQRIHLARVLAQVWAHHRPERPFTLLLDEPTASLDLRHQHLVLRLARSLAGEGVAVLVVLHDLTLAARYADRMHVLKDGRAVANGPPAAVLTADLLSRCYGVEGRVTVGSAGIQITI